jgi:hypothetical protein
VRDGLIADDIRKFPETKQGVTAQWAPYSAAS